jgi:Uncharacterized protein involved in formate dehydrogenase formation
VSSGAWARIRRGPSIAQLITVSTASLTRTGSLRSTTAEQLAPVLRAHAEVMRGCTPLVDVTDARTRVEGGHVAYDALRVLRSVGDLAAAFVRMLDAFEVAGLVSNAERRAVLGASYDIDDLVCGWCTGDHLARDITRRLAQQVAMTIGNAILRRATSLVGRPVLWHAWTKVVCPCCGGAPDIALTDGALRTLVCARCDAEWLAPRDGCLGCDADATALHLARITNAALGYDLLMCNDCGRFMKERARVGIAPLLVERAITAELDRAAELRGLRT